MDVQAGRYRDIAELGRGGMGDVYLTVASGPAGFNKLLVVKRLRPSLALDPELLRMFLHEARIAARLNHPNIVQTYEVGAEGAQYFIAMEYLQGQSMFHLGRAAAAKGGLPLAMQLRIMVDALAGLHHAHEQRDYDGTELEIVHRDVSPPNIFVLYDGQVKIVDFGIAKTADGDETRAGVFKGKIQYMAPEQYGGGHIDRRADIYSMGVILWEALTRRRMWKGAGDLAVMQRVVAGDVPPPSSVSTDVPEDLEAICMRAIALDPSDRHPTAAALQSELEEFMDRRGHRASAREVGKLTSELFVDMRARMKDIIDSQLKTLREGSDGLSLIPMVTAQQPTMTGTAAWLPPPQRARPRAWRRVARWVAGAAMLGAAGSVGFWLARPMSNRAAPTPASAALETIVTTPAMPPAAAPSAASPSASTAAASVVPPESSAAAPAATHPVERLRLTIETVPHNAKVALDDALLPPDTRQLEMVKDYAVHMVWAAAPGYRAKSEWIRFDADSISVKIALDARVSRQRGDGGKDAFRRPLSDSPPPSDALPAPAASGASPPR